jgi:hypothetical protein
MKTRNLGILTLILFIFSIFVYTNENKKETDLIAGSDFVKGIDLNKVQKISLSFGEKKIILTRDGARFVVENHKSYPAATERVNELIYKIASVQVREKIEDKSRPEDLSRYGLDPKSSKYLIEIFDNDGKRTVAFRVGKSVKGRGNYLYKEGRDEIYLSNNELWLNSSYKDFINTVLLKVDKEKLQKIVIKDKEAIELERENSNFVLKTADSKKAKEEKIEEFINNLGHLSFEDYFRPKDSTVSSLNFEKEVELKMNNKLIYKLALAKSKTDYFLRLQALVDEAPSRIVVNQDANKEELQKIEDTIKVQGQAQRVNLELSPWVYKISKEKFEKLSVSKKFFL